MSIFVLAASLFPTAGKNIVDQVGQEGSMCLCAFRTDKDKRGTKEGKNNPTYENTKKYTYLCTSRELFDKINTPSFPPAFRFGFGGDTIRPAAGIYY